jgi:metal-responsive CopG/Arc/MetJ family transcriptional regulator
MNKNRRLKDYSATRLIVSLETATVEAVDKLIGKPFGRKHPVKGNRSEFVRQAIEEKLERDAALVKA